MKNYLFMPSMVVVLSFNILSFSAFACGGDIDMTVPHIHDESGIFIAIETAERNALENAVLQDIDIYQVFAGELAAPKHQQLHIEDTGN